MASALKRDYASFQDTLLSMPSPTHSDVNSPRKKKLRVIISHQKKRLKKYRDRNYRLKKIANARTEKAVVEKLLIGRSDMVKKFIRSQLFHKKKTSWTGFEKKMSLSIYYESASCYKFLLNQGFKLPAVRI